MSKKQNQKLITPEIMHQAMIGSFTKLNPRYMMKNPVMFVVEIGCIISLIFAIFSFTVIFLLPPVSDKSCLNFSSFTLIFQTIFSIAHFF